MRADGADIATVSVHSSGMCLAKAVTSGYRSPGLGL